MKAFRYVQIVIVHLLVLPVEGKSTGTEHNRALSTHKYIQGAQYELTVVIERSSGHYEAERFDAKP